MNKILMVGLIMFACFNIAAKASVDSNSAPFGFRWGDDLEVVKSKLTGQYEIIDDQERCPFVIVKTKNLDNRIEDIGEYELLIMSKYDGISFGGLIAISYKSQPDNMKDYYPLISKIIKNLKRDYGVLQQARSIDRTERYYFFEGHDLTINLTAEQSKDHFYIDLEYAYTGNRNNGDTEEGFATAVEECKKQRSKH